MRIWTRGAAAATALVLAACGAADPRDPFADSRAPPGLAERFHAPEGWAWGLVAAGDGPLQRYGVGAPRGVAKGQVLILPDYPETAETWFETARDLIDADYAVWVLEGVGQGGSARLSMRRDLGEVKSFDGDVQSARALIRDVIRPEPGRPFVVLGEGVGALTALRAVQTGARAAGLILSAPACGAAGDGGPLHRVGLGLVRASAGGAWRREGPDDAALGRTHDAWRGAVTHAWQTANPDLRLGGPSLDWAAALDDLRRSTDAGGAPGMPVLILEAGRPGACLAVPGARRLVLAGADSALELEQDRWRSPWLTAIQTFLAGLNPPAPRASHGAFQRG